jgi:hypothetical protein
MEGAFDGSDGVKEFVTGLLDVFEFRTNFSDVRDLGDRVLAIGTQTTIARGSGIEQETLWRSSRPTGMGSSPASRITAKRS